MLVPLLAYATATTTDTTAPWLDASLSVDQRVELLLAQMTNAEKQAQTLHLTGSKWPDIEKQYGTTSFGAIGGQGNGSAASVEAMNERQASGSRVSSCGRQPFAEPAGGVVQSLATESSLRCASHTVLHRCAGLLRQQLAPPHPHHVPL